MTAVEVINIMIPALDRKDDAHEALAWMERLRCSHLPVVESDQLLGFVSRENLIKADELEKKISRFEMTGKTCVVDPHAGLNAILDVASRHNMKMAAVLNNKKQYEGVVKTQDAMATCAQAVAIKTSGKTLTLSLDGIDYSLAEIGRLVEENNAKIVSSVVMEDEMNSNKIKLSLKIDQSDLTRIIATLERFDYRVIGKYYGEQHQSEENNERVDMLMRYLNI